MKLFEKYVINPNTVLIAAEQDENGQIIQK